MVPSNAQSGKALIGMADRTRRCSIEIKDADTDAIMIFTAATGLETSCESPSTRFWGW
jgi:hypothetical protein